jgi:hypothetical protein
MHPDGKVHRGTILIIRSNIRHYEIGKYQKELQAISIATEDRDGCIIISVYSPPKHTIKKEYNNFF